MALTSQMQADSEGLGSVSSSAMDFPSDFGHVTTSPSLYLLLGRGLGGDNANFSLFLRILLVWLIVPS